MSNQRRWFSVSMLLASAAAVVVLLSCGGGSGIDEPVQPSVLTFIDTITLVSSPDTNEDDKGRVWPLGIDLVRHTDERVLTRIGELSASEWFEQYPTLKSDYPDLMVNNWEIPAGDTIGPDDISVDVLVGGFVFANYNNQSEPHRRRLNVGGELRIYLERTTFRIEGDPAPGFWGGLSPF